MFPFAHIIAPLIVWMLKRDASAFVNDQGKESVNAQITATIYAAICVPFCFVLIGFVMLLPLWLAGVVLVIIGGDGRLRRPGVPLSTNPAACHDSQGANGSLSESGKESG